MLTDWMLFLLYWSKFLSYIIMQLNGCYMNFIVHWCWEEPYRSLHDGRVQPVFTFWRELNSETWNIFWDVHTVSVRLEAAEPAEYLETSTSSWYSSQISSRVFLLVSGISRVLKIPKNINRAKISMTWGNQQFFGLPSLAQLWSIKVPRAVWAIMAPILPEAAEIPWAEDLYLVGKTSPGTIKVVTLGPNCMKNWQTMYRPKRLLSLS